MKIQEQGEIFQIKIRSTSDFSDLLRLHVTMATNIWLKQGIVGRFWLPLSWMQMGADLILLLCLFDIYI